MNKQPIMITLPINLAHLMSLSGMLREYGPEKIHSIFGLQVFHQAKQQNMVLDGPQADYDFLKTKTLYFNIPTGCVADVGKVLMEVSKEWACSDFPKDSRATAVDVLIAQWTPFVIAAMEAHGLGKQAPHAHNRLTDYPPESLN